MDPRAATTVRTAVGAGAPGAFLADIGNADRCAAVIQSGRQSKPEAKYTSIFYLAKQLGLWRLGSG